MENLEIIEKIIVYIIIFQVISNPSTSLTFKSKLWLKTKMYFG